MGKRKEESAMVEEEEDKELGRGRIGHGGGVGKKEKSTMAEEELGRERISHGGVGEAGMRKEEPAMAEQLGRGRKNQPRRGDEEKGFF